MQEMVTGVKVDIDGVSHISGNYNVLELFDKVIADSATRIQDLTLRKRIVIKQSYGSSVYIENLHILKATHLDSISPLKKGYMHRAYITVKNLYIPLSFLFGET